MLNEAEATDVSVVFMPVSSKENTEPSSTAHFQMKSAEGIQHPVQNGEGGNDESDESNKEATESSNHSSMEDECGGDSDDSKIVSMV